MKIKRLIDVGDFFAWLNFGCLRGKGKSNNGHIHHYPCGQCPACKKQKSNEWVCRLSEEYKHSQSAYFVTLTYDDYFIPIVEPYKFDVHSPFDEYECTKEAVPFPWQVGIEVVNKRDCQLWLKRIRRKLSKDNIKMRYFLVSEYGGQTYRPHYHAILFFDKIIDERQMHRYLLDSWIDVTSHCGKGFIESSLVTPRRINYVAKYATTITDLPEHLQVKEYRPFMLSSRRKAIGHQYIEDQRNVRYHRETLDRHYVVDKYEYALPKYYYYKMFDAFERKLMEAERNRKDNPYDKLDERYQHYYELSGELLTDEHTYYKSVIQDTIKKIRNKSNKNKI